VTLPALTRLAGSPDGTACRLGAPAAASGLASLCATIPATMTSITMRVRCRNKLRKSSRRFQCQLLPAALWDDVNRPFQWGQRRQLSCVGSINIRKNGTGTSESTRFLPYTILFLALNKARPATKQPSTRVLLPKPLFQRSRLIPAQTRQEVTGRIIYVKRLPRLRLAGFREDARPNDSPTLGWLVFVLIHHALLS
jgi:hypothetical protein